MSDTVKLIIEIPKDYYEIIKHEVYDNHYPYRPFVIIANGTPLDDVKAEIEKASFEHYMEFGEYIGEDCRKEKIVYLDNILEIIGKAESED